MRLLVPALSGLALLLSSTPAHADQLQCNRRAVAEQAADLLLPGSYVLDFCSLCRATPIQVVRVERAEVIEDCQHEVRLTGQVVLRSERTFDDGKEAAAPTSFMGSDAPFASSIDLAYLYVETGPGVFEWLGGQLGLDATVNVATIRLPSVALANLGGHPRPELGPDGLPPPDAEAVRRVWHHFYSGQGRPPILVEAKACLKINTEKGTPGRFTCALPVSGPVPRGSLVYAWMSWLVPLGDADDQAIVQFIHEGTVRTTKDIRLRGGGLKTRFWKGARLYKLGTWEIVIRRGDEELKVMTVVVEPKTED